MTNFKLETLDYQEDAISTIVNCFRGAIRNNYDNAFDGTVYANKLVLDESALEENIKAQIVKPNYYENLRELTVEMETGTGKTLVYIKSIYELHKEYGFTKFIITVPSVAIREGVINAFDIFKEQLHEIYGFTPDYFEYDSKKLNKVKSFTEQNHPQVMIITMAAFNADDNIINRTDREDMYFDGSMIENIAKTNPIVVMDEPQEGMDTPIALKAFEKLNPLFKIRFSATHKIAPNLIYQLTPYDSYKKGLVKKIEVLSVTQQNHESVLNLSLVSVNPKTLKAKLKAWHYTNNGIEYKVTKQITVDDNLEEITNNPIYKDFVVKGINKLKGVWEVQFHNGFSIDENTSIPNINSIWEAQIEWLIKRHFKKQDELKELGIKCLSLIFIDRVDNYVGEDPKIKDLFEKKYIQLFTAKYGNQPTQIQVNSVQGSYFAKTSGKNGNYTDSTTSMNSNSDLYDAILKDKKGLTQFGDEVANKVEFIFSHSALGVGWDNPNVFNIATLSNSYSEIKKRQEIGRGLRICVDQEGQRVYDLEGAKFDNLINTLTVVPNETYESFASEYQRELGGNNALTPKLENSPNGERQTKKNNYNRKENIQTAFKKFWEKIARKTNYIISIDENTLIEKCTEELNKLKLKHSQVVVSGTQIESIEKEKIHSTHLGATSEYYKDVYQPIDFIEEISESTGMSYNTSIAIFKRIDKTQLLKNPNDYLYQATRVVNRIANNEMIRCVQYFPLDEYIEFDEENPAMNETQRIISQLQKGMFETMYFDSDVELNFAEELENDNRVVCFIKLPSYYKIPTPLGDYNPDFGVVVRCTNLENQESEDFDFVIEIKGTNNIEALTYSEKAKIECAVQHFRAIGIEASYKAPISNYSEFDRELCK